MLKTGRVTFNCDIIYMQTAITKCNYQIYMWTAHKTSRDATEITSQCSGPQSSEARIKLKLIRNNHVEVTRSTLECPVNSNSFLTIVFLIITNL